MSALAEHLRQRAQADVQQLSPDERIMLALALGDDDLRMFCAASGEDRAAAVRRLTAMRQQGRRVSACASMP
jgi:hypothetical protein